MKIRLEMPQVAQVKSSKKKGAVASFVIGLVVLFLVIVAIVFVYWLEVPPISSIVTKANNLDTASNFTQAEAILKPALPRTMFNKSDREKVLLALGTTEYDLGNYSTAVTYYQQLNNLNPGQEAVIFELSTAAQSAQNNAVELAADKQLLPLVEADEIGPTRQNDISDIQNRIAELEK